MRETYGDDSEYYYDNAYLKYIGDNNVKLRQGVVIKPWVNNSNDDIIGYIKKNASKFPKPTDSVKQSLKQEFSKVAGELSDLSGDEDMDYSGSNSNSNSISRIKAPIPGRYNEFGRAFHTSSSNRASPNTANAYLSYPPLFDDGPKNFGRPSMMASNPGSSGYASNTSTVFMGEGSDEEGDGTGYDTEDDDSADDDSNMKEVGGSKRSRKRQIKKRNSKKRVKKTKGRKTRKVRRVKKSKPKKRSLKRKVQKPKPKTKSKSKSKAKKRSIKRKVQKNKSKKSGKKSKLLKTKKRGIKKNTRRK